MTIAPVQAATAPTAPRRKPDIYNWLDMIAGPLAGQLARQFGGANDPPPPVDPAIAGEGYLDAPAATMDTAPMPVAGDAVLDGGPKLDDLVGPPTDLSVMPPMLPAEAPAPPPTPVVAPPPVSAPSQPPAILAPLANRRRQGGFGMGSGSGGMGMSRGNMRN